MGGCNIPGVCRALTEPGEILGNSVCPIDHKEQDDAFRYPCAVVSYCENTEYTAEFIVRTLKKAICDYSKDSNNTSFMFVPDWKSAYGIRFGINYRWPKLLRARRTAPLTLQLLPQFVQKED